ncbi:MAG: hypothetical protein JO004_04580 [Methylobacteriaceae bacterium]|nr:hypothetical protein [Methylobacteriaceae bacterium]
MQTSLGTLHDAETRGDFFGSIAEISPAATPPQGTASAALSLAQTSAEHAILLDQAASARDKIAKIRAKDMFVRL